MHRVYGYAGAAALPPGIGFITSWFLHATAWSDEDKGMAGGTPANPATLEIERAPARAEAPCD